MFLKMKVNIKKFIIILKLFSAKFDINRSIGKRGIRFAKNQPNKTTSINSESVVNYTIP